MISADQTIAAAADELRRWSGRIILIIFRSIPAPIILSIVVWRIYSGPLSDLTCSFEADWRLLSLWPANLNYIRQLQNTHFTQADQCWFFAVTSTASAVYLGWLCWLMCRCIFVLRKMQHVRGTAKYILPKIGGFFVIVILGLATGAGLMLTVGFEPSRGPAGLTTLLPMGWSASKVIFFIIPYSYAMAGFAVNMLLLLLRYVAYRVQEAEV